jgi:atypical dual specificity phosphatase
MANRDKVLPPYPRTLILPHKPNGTQDDLVASESEAAVVFKTTRLHAEEKLDGANIGIAIVDEHPIIRNRDHFLSKASAKGQFASIWGWYYKNREKFDALQDYGPFSVYGEWLVARHTIPYTRLPDWFVAYDLYNPRIDSFLAPATSRRILTDCGFSLAPVLHDGPLEDGYEQLEQLVHAPSVWANSPVEGVYLKVCNHEVVTHRFKMVREDFEHKPMWTEMVRNELA